MKSINTVIILSLALLLSASCNKLESNTKIDEQPEGNITTLSVDFPTMNSSSDTKVDFELTPQKGYKLKWEVGDLISIYSRKYLNKQGWTTRYTGNFKCVEVDPITRKGTFKAMPYKPFPNSRPTTPKLSDGDYYIAVYPAYKDRNLDDRSKFIKTSLEDQTQETVREEQLDENLFMEDIFIAGRSSIQFQYEVAYLYISFIWETESQNDFPDLNEMLVIDGVNEYKLSHTNYFIESAGGQDGLLYNIPIAVMPSSGNRNISITVSSTYDGDSKMFTTSTSNKWEAGKVYYSQIPKGFVTYDYIENGVNYGKGVTIDGLIWAPVNCGYEEATADYNGYPFGKLYQWGREFGQGYEFRYVEEWGGAYKDATYPTEENNTILNAIEIGTTPKDNTFYKGDPSWQIDGYYNYNWNDIPAEYSPKVANPCPTGWRVPSITELQNLATNHSDVIKSGVTGPNGESQIGTYYSGSRTYSERVPRIFLPASGYRTQNGSSRSRGYEANYWSSTPHGRSAYALVNRPQGDNKAATMRVKSAFGNSVRCVKDL